MSATTNLVGIFVCDRCGEEETVCEPSTSDHGGPRSSVGKPPGWDEVFHFHRRSLLCERCMEACLASFDAFMNTAPPQRVDRILDLAGVPRPSIPNHPPPSERGKPGDLTCGES